QQLADESVKHAVIAMAQVISRAIPASHKLFYCTWQGC
ncbi:MAG: hypothetical protein ACI9PC_001238, partial [Porticoccaceae bacterium]